MRSGGDGGKIDSVRGQSERRLSIKTQFRRRITRVDVDVVAHAADNDSQNSFRREGPFYNRQRACGGRECERRTARRSGEFYGVISGWNLIHRPLRVLKVRRRSVIEKKFFFFLGAGGGFCSGGGGGWGGGTTRQRLRSVLLRWKRFRCGRSRCLLMSSREKPNYQHK